MIRNYTKSPQPEIPPQRLYVSPRVSPTVTSMTSVTLMTWFKNGMQAIPLIFLMLASAQSNNVSINPTPAISSTHIADAPFIFQSEFNRLTWSGNLRKIDISKQTDGNLIIAKQAQWDAATQLAKLAPAQRIIVTYNTSTKQTVPFELNQLPDDIQARFNIQPNSIPNASSDASTRTAIKDELGAARVSYLRGERTMEKKSNDSSITQFRVRDSVLGDIMHSAPIYVGAPTKNIIDGNYASFYDQHKKRPATVFVGANDGMLHAFSADSGTELFAYIPSPILKKLPKLTSTAYQHEPMMDGNLQVSEAQVSGQWKTVLAAGMGQGAKGVFALDVTSPDKFMEGERVLFEFTEQDDPDMGYVTAPPSIVKISTEKNKRGNITYKYFALVSNGTTADVPNNNSQPYLFLLSLDKSPNTPWSRNTNYYKISTSNTTSSTVHALSAPGLVLNAQRATTYAYSGDLQGNVWRFDFTNHNPATASSKVIFTAKDQHDNPQPISAQPVVSYATDGGYMILFGTGESEETTNIKKNNLKHNSFYSIRDMPKGDKDNAVSARSQLAFRKLEKITRSEKSGYQVSGQDFSYGTSSSDKKGWYVDYVSDPSAANQCVERTASKGVLAFGSIFFNTTCNENNEDSGHSYMLNALTGKTHRANEVAGLKSKVGAPGMPALITTHVSLANRDSIGRRYNAQHYSVLNFGTGRSDNVSGVSTASDPSDSSHFAEVLTSTQAELKAGRLSWREIPNWQDLNK